MDKRKEPKKKTKTLKKETKDPKYEGYEVKLKETNKPPKTVEVYNYLTGGSIKEIDEPRAALRPGRRVSRNGNTYWEFRRNRADLNPTEGL